MLPETGIGCNCVLLEEATFNALLVRGQQLLFPAGLQELQELQGAVLS
jgi:hypothetical protein